MAQIDISKIKKAQSVNKNESNPFDFLSRDLSFGKATLSDKKKEGFYNELGTLIRSGIDIRSALELTIGSYTQKKDIELFKSLQQKVIEGRSLSATLQDESKFSPYEYYSVKIGEETGRLGEVLGELAGFYKAKISQQRKIIGAITYPLLVLFTSFAAVFFMIKFVVPMFADVFTRFGGKLPFLTALIVSFSNWLDSYIYLLIFILLSIIAAYFLCRKKPWFKKHITLIVLRIPLVGEITKKVYLARFANTMRLLTQTNTPLLQALELIRQMITFYPIEHSLLAAEQDILLGKSLSEALSKHEFYPAKFVQMIRIAEEVNKLEYFFGQLSEQYTEEVEYKTNAISGLLEPLIIIFLGLVVGVILIAMYLPMFQMSSSF